MASIPSKTGRQELACHLLVMRYHPFLPSSDQGAPAMSLIEQTVGRTALTLPGATRVFRDHNIDFCCGGRISLREAAERVGLAPEALVDALEALPAGASDERDWQSASNDELIDHILTRYHDVHRQQLPELVRMARRVEQVHGERDTCPTGLADLLTTIYQDRK